MSRWMNDAFREGNKKELELTDLYKVLPTDRSEALGDKLTRAWKKQLEKCEKQNGNLDSTSKVEPSLGKAILTQFLSSYMLFGLFAFFEECVTR